MREGTDVDDLADTGALQDFEELLDGSRRMADRVENR